MKELRTRRSSWPTIMKVGRELRQVEGRTLSCSQCRDRGEDYEKDKLRRRDWDLRN